MPPNREPMWYCHECGAEMRPLMVPDPQCASCNGTFVEMIESTQDDPRVFHGMGEGGDFDDFPGPFSPHLRDLFPGPTTPGGGGGFTFVNRSSSPGTRTFLFRSGQSDNGPDRVMPLTEFLTAHGEDGGGRITRDGPAPGGIPSQHLLINQIVGMLSQRHTDQGGPGAPHPLADIFAMHGLRGGPEGGRLGDYALNQQALDQIMTALMENSNAHRPVPATDEVLSGLHHQVLEEGSPLFEKECAVCKDQFSLKTEDPDEQVVITLPCNHPFHSPCILPWLKQNGTCPSCRYQLVPQPGSTPNPNENPRPGSGPSTATSNLPQPTATANPFPQPRTGISSSRWSASSRNRDRESPESGDGSGGFLGMVGNLFHSFAGGHQNSGPAPSSSSPGPGSFPGSWDPNPRPEPGNTSSHSRNQATQSNRGMYPNSGPPRPLPSPHDQLGLNSSHNTSSSSRGRGRGSTPEWAFGRHRRGSRERERNRDRNGQRRNTNPWDNPDLD